MWWRRPSRSRRRAIGSRWSPTGALHLVILLTPPPPGTAALPPWVSRRIGSATATTAAAVTNESILQGVPHWPLATPLRHELHGADPPSPRAYLGGGFGCRVVGDQTAPLLSGDAPWGPPVRHGGIASPAPIDANEPGRCGVGRGRSGDLSTGPQKFLQNLLPSRRKRRIVSAPGAFVWSWGHSRQPGRAAGDPGARRLAHHPVRRRLPQGKRSDRQAVQRRSVRTPRRERRPALP